MTENSTTGTEPENPPALEARIETKEVLSKSNEKNSLGEAEKILPLEEYVSKFSQRYAAEPAFQKIVHKYLDLGKVQRVKLKLSRKIAPGWYRKQTNHFINEYAARIREDLVIALKVKMETDALEKEEEELEKMRKELTARESKRAEVERRHAQVSAEKNQAVDQTNQEAMAKKLEEERRKFEQEEIIRKRTNANEIVQDSLRGHLVKSPLLQTDALGKLKFDEKKLVHHLEDLFLKEIIDGIEEDTGKGFLARVKSDFYGLISYWAELEDITELPNVDWVQSAIYSRTKGYRIPRYPYLISGKYEDTHFGKTTLDQAIILDCSGSNRHNNRMEAGRKTCLADAALMRKLNPENNVYLGVYSTTVRPVTELELLRSITPDGATRTDLALKWLLDTLEDKGPAIATLITDGYPESEDGRVSAAEMVEKTIRVAKKFQEYPQIKLRMFLIDSTKDTRDIMRRIGRAAGAGTKIAPVDNYQLGSGVIKDLSEVITELRDISQF